jgi:hypothetical protein
VIRGRGGALTAVVAAAAVASLAAAGPARGALDAPGAPAGPLQVTLLSPTAEDPLAGRLEAELHTIGVDVARDVLSPAGGIEEQVHVALAGGARAVVVADGHRTEVWIAQRGSDRVGLRQELEVDETSGLQAVLALRTVEFLRISLGLVTEPNIVPLAAPPVVATAPPAPAPKRWLSADASSGVLAASGGGGTIAIAGIAVRAQLWGMLGAEICLYAPLTEAELANANGAAQTSVWMAGGGVLLAPRPEGRVSVEVAAGSLAAVVRSRGVAFPATGGSLATDQATRAAVYGRGAARLRLAPRLSLRLDLFGGAVIKPPSITFVETTVATWGPAFAAGVGGAELRF